jgi:hypothetical protein
MCGFGQGEFFPFIVRSFIFDIIPRELVSCLFIFEIREDDLLDQCRVFQD